jgi:hypothetical protein
LENILRSHIIGCNGINQRLVSDIPGVVLDDVVIQGFENIVDKPGFSTTGRAININPLFELEVGAIGFVIGENISDTLYNRFSL